MCQLRACTHEYLIREVRASCFDRNTRESNFKATGNRSVPAIDFEPMQGHWNKFLLQNKLNLPRNSIKEYSYVLRFYHLIP